MKFAPQDALDIPADIANEGAVIESTKCPTVYRVVGSRKRAIAQFITFEGAKAYRDELVREGQKDLVIGEAKRSPVRSKCIRRGGHRTYGIQQVAK